MTNFVHWFYICKKKNIKKFENEEESSSAAVNANYNYNNENYYDKADSMIDDEELDYIEELAIFEPKIDDFVMYMTTPHETLKKEEV